MKIPLSAQIAEIEAIMARTVDSVKSGALTADVANERLPLQSAIWGTLKWLEENMDWIREEAKRRK